MTETPDPSLALHLKALRQDRGWSLDTLARRSKTSRATLSRIENAGVSPTVEVLGRLCAAFGLAPSRVLMATEDGFRPLIPFDDQLEWSDPETGLTRRAVSPQASALAGQIQECHLPPDTAISEPASGGREYHLVMLDGALRITSGDTVHDLTAGDCLRLITAGATGLRTGPGRGARYLLILV